MNLDEYWSAVEYWVDEKLRNRKGEPTKGNEDWAYYLRRNFQHIFLGRCPLCYPQEDKGPEICVDVPAADQWNEQEKSELKARGYVPMEGDLRSYYQWPTSSLYFKSLRAEPGWPGFSYFSQCERNHNRSTHIFLNFHGRKPDFDRLQSLGFPYLNPEVPFLIPYLMNKRTVIEKESIEEKGRYMKYALGGAVTIVQGKIPDPWAGYEVTYSMVSTFAQFEKWPEGLNPVWDNTVGTREKADCFNCDVLPVKDYIHPFTGEVIPLEAWYDWKPWVEAGLVTWWDQTRPGHYVERSRDWESFPLKDQSGRKRILHLYELDRDKNDRDSASSVRPFNTWEETLAYYDSQDFDVFDEKKIRAGYRSMNYTIFGGDE